MIRAVFQFAGDTEQAAPVPPAGITLERDTDAPAGRLELTFESGAALFGREPCGVRLERGGTVLFTGVIDEHRICLEGGAREELFSLRSRVALLQDSEAEPGTLRMPSLRLMEQRFLSPFGMKAEDGDFSPKQGEMIVEKGTSCWNALCAFSERFLRCTPYGTRAGNLRFAARTPKRLRLQAVRSIEYSYRPEMQISRVVVQSTRTGAYSAVFENDAAEIPRMRYRAAQEGQSPREIIEAGEQGAFGVRVVCGGFVDAEPGDVCDFSGLGSAYRHMRLTGMQYRLVREMEETELRFERGGTEGEG